MKRLTLSLSLAILVLTATSCTTTMGSRVADGLKSIVTSPLQVSDAVREETPKAEFPPFGAAGGSAKGAFYMAKQVFDGIATILTFFNTK